MGLSQSALANKLRLLTVSPEIRTAAEEAQLTERHIRALLRLQSREQQLEMIGEIQKKSAHRQPDRAQSGADPEEEETKAKAARNGTLR